MEYYTHQGSVVLTFKVVEQGNNFLSECLQREKKVIKEHVDAFIIERHQYLKEL